MDRKFSMTRICMVSEKCEYKETLSDLHPTDIFQTAEGLFMLLRQEKGAAEKESLSSVMLLFPAQVMVKMPSKTTVYVRQAKIIVMEDY